MSLIWYIYGAGGLGNETMDILKREIELKKINNHECVFIDDNLNKEEIFGSKVTRLESCVLNSKVTIAVGEPEVRELLSIKCKEKGLRLTTIVSSYSFISKSVKFCSVSIINWLLSTLLILHVPDGWYFSGFNPNEYKYINEFGIFVCLFNGW